MVTLGRPCLDAVWLRAWMPPFDYDDFIESLDDLFTTVVCVHLA